MSSRSEQALRHFDLKALYESSQLLNASLDLDVVLGNLLLTVMSKLLVMRGLVLLYDPLQSVYRVAAVKGIPSVEQGREMTLDIEADRTLWLDNELPPALAAHRLALMLPITFQDRHIGLVCIGRKANGQPCEADELEFLQSLVNMSSAAVHNSLMVEELQIANRDLDSKVQELNTLFDLSKEFNATRDRARLVKLLSYALMGQLLVQRHLFLLRQDDATGDAAGDAAGDEPMYRVVTSQAVDATKLSADLCRALCDRQDLILLDSDDDPRWEELRAMGLHIVLPLHMQGETTGVLALGPKITGQAYQPSDIEFLYALGNLALTSIQNTYLLEEQIEKERLEEEMRLAREIQERLLPREDIDFPGLDLASYATPSLHVAGDYFDVIPLSGNRLLLAIADVTGKGVPAALLMANIQACLRMVSPIEMTLEEATSRINRVIHQNTGYDKFITFFWGFYDEETRVFNYINAGHEPPMHLRRDGTIERLEAGGLLLGVYDGATYERGVAMIEPGDVVLFYTDGVNEAMDPDDNQYGEEGMAAVLREHRDGTAREILTALLADVRRFTRGARQSDDLTAIVIKGA